MTDQQTSGPVIVDRDTASTAELVRLAVDQVTRLARNELQLARAEMSGKARRFGAGAGLFGGAGVVALYGLAALVAAAVLVLALVMPAWLAALIVAVVLFAVAGVMGLLGRGQIRRGSPATPEQTLNSVKADVQTVTDAVRKRGYR
jgi:Putative Actinobacterial Holin-X, holin superfamily III